MICKKLFIVPLLGLVCTSLQTYAAVSVEEAARLNKDLTPVGAERNASPDGVIPAWTGGIKEPPAGFNPGDHHQDPFSKDTILFTITANNVSKYQDKLSPGQVALLKKYATYKINVYPTHRSASYPPRVYQALAKNATTAGLYQNADSVENSVVTSPFPIPKNGQEAIWNHLLRYRGEMTRAILNTATPTASGDYSLSKVQQDMRYNYSLPNQTPAALENVLIYFKTTTLSPARHAGESVLVHETLNQVQEPRRAWIYNPGQRRVRRAPNLAYDNPIPGSILTTDQFDMFSGATDRYNWKLIGKQSLYVPYNSYKLHSDQLKYQDILTPGHINADFARYELHRVWVVEATLKKGTRHLYPRRLFYIDEDSWTILEADSYDQRGNVWQVSESHPINFYELPALYRTVEVHHDLQLGRYTVIGLKNEETMIDFSVNLEKKDFTPSVLRRSRRRR